MLHFCGAALKFPWRSLLTPHLLALQDCQTQPECLLWPHSALLLCAQKSVSCTERNKSGRLFKVTGSHVHWENGNISEMAQHIHVVAADHWQEMSYACWIVPFLMTVTCCNAVRRTCVTTRTVSTDTRGPSATAEVARTSVLFIDSHMRPFVKLLWRQLYIERCDAYYILGFLVLWCNKFVLLCFVSRKLCNSISWQRSCLITITWRNQTKRQQSEINLNIIWWR